MMIAALSDDQYDGLYNGSAPEPLTNKALVQAVKKGKNGIGLVMPVPELALKLTMGDMTQMLTNSTRAIPKKMIDQKYDYKFTNAADAVRDLIDKKI
jgi:NAD dependent epimerase/dehydratase family enzyme